MPIYIGPRQLAGVAIVFFVLSSPANVGKAHAFRLSSAARIEGRGTVNNVRVIRNTRSRSSCSSCVMSHTAGVWNTAAHSHAHGRGRSRAENVHGLLRSSAGDGEDATSGRGGDNLESFGDVDGDMSMSSLLGAQALQALGFWRNRKPSPDLPPDQVIGLLMAALQKNSPADNDGLTTVFNFSSGMCRMAVGGTAESFVKEARYSVFGATVNCKSFTLDPMQTVGDRLATQVVNVVAADGRQRRFLWTLERQRRPPDTGKWLIYGVVSSDFDGALTMDG